MKRTYIATNRIAGIFAPKKDKDGTILGEHVLETGDEISLEDKDAAQLVASGALVLKSDASDSVLLELDKEKEARERALSEKELAKDKDK